MRVWRVSGDLGTTTTTAMTTTTTMPTATMTDDNDGRWTGGVPYTLLEGPASAS